MIAAGTCAAFGGIGASGWTQASGLQFLKKEPGGLLGEDFRSRTGLPVINLAGCPCHTEVITGTLSALIADGPCMSSAPTARPCAVETMTGTTIICLGNRYVAGDDVGCRVFDYLSAGGLPEALAIVDGGLCGLDLLTLVEGRRRVVFVDAVAGLADAGAVVVLSQEQVAAYAGGYGHGAGLPYLLRLLPQVCVAPLPEIALVGTELMGAEDAEDESAIGALAARCMEVAINGV